MLLTCTATFAAEGGYPLDKAPYRVNDMASLQNGAKLFVNYCLNCHSASSMRYNKLKDIGLTDQQIKESLLFTGEKVGDMMPIRCPQFAHSQITLVGRSKTFPASRASNNAL